ncbi:IPT/TIG domain-containing protein [Chloroflexota bacterium]
MKNASLFKILAMGVILSLLVVLIPASPALAAREIDLEKDEGEIGEFIDIDGDGFTPSDSQAEPEPLRRYVDIYFTSEEVSVGDDIDDEITVYQLVEDKISVDDDGEFSDRFQVPVELESVSPDEAVRGGTYYVLITRWNDEDIKAFAEFTVISGEITTFSPDNGPVGTEVEVLGELFGEREDITVTYDGDSLDIVGDDSADGSGDIDFTIIIPPSTAGDHTVIISDETLTEAEETFTVEPAMSFTPTQAPPGDTVEVSGTGYGGGESVDITLGIDLVASGDTDDEGNFSISFTVPEVDEGTYDLVAEDDEGNDVQDSFTVEIGTAATINPLTSTSSPGHVGTSVTVNGVSFLANSTITITYASDPQVVATTTSDANGDFNATFTIPPSEAGAHTITVGDGTNDPVVLPFYMESQAPPVPQPLAPEMGAKAASLTQFDWEGVIDDSGVTYELQVATSEDFSAASMVLETMGLTASEYTLTDEQALASRSEEEPYYWRVRAIDGASNVGGWSDAGTFHLGFAFPDWIIHLWWGLGVLGAIFLGYYLGKRRAYYY